ncbi:hypothetical protein [Chelativorans sp. AA-79]|uniref:hypothetical protein n=1 Tax=Chelativorans sp. AA-79 TaxID=3028735 RepID=UPI0023F76D23|nr:hypothetical protein [Chelativorans sp. AA-79]WEX10421.1 hypothetical protein PVE73_05545 [Chelativorans sp. AA-79]
MALIIGMGITRLLAGVARFVQHPSRSSLSIIHLAWVGTTLLMLVHFWWWEVALYDIGRWSFGVFFFLIVYTIVLFLMSALLFPDDIKEYKNYEDFFLDRRKWFFGLLASTLVLDVIDTYVKGEQHFDEYRIELLVSTPIFFTLCVLAMWTASRAFHLAVVGLNMIYEAVWIATLFNIPD